MKTRFTIRDLRFGREVRAWGQQEHYDKTGKLIAARWVWYARIWDPCVGWMGNVLFDKPFASRAKCEAAIESETTATANR